MQKKYKKNIGLFCSYSAYQKSVYDVDIDLKCFIDHEEYGRLFTLS